MNRLRIEDVGQMDPFLSGFYNVVHSAIDDEVRAELTSKSGFLHVEEDWSRDGEVLIFSAQNRKNMKISLATSALLDPHRIVFGIFYHNAVISCSLKWAIEAQQLKVEGDMLNEVRDFLHDWFTGLVLIRVFDWHGLPRRLELYWRDRCLARKTTWANWFLPRSRRFGVFSWRGARYCAVETLCDAS